MGTNFSQHPDRPGNTAGLSGELIACESSECSTRAVSWFDLRHLCLEHLVLYCYARLEICQQECTRRYMLDSNSLEIWARFLDECTQKILVLLLKSNGLQNSDRAHLIDIFLWATELNQRYGSIPQRWRAASR